MEIKLVVVGSVKERFLQNKIERLQADIGRRMPVCMICVKDESIPKQAHAAAMKKIKDAEGDRILDKINGSDYVAALCIDGIMQDDSGLKRILRRAEELEKASVTFVIGGSLGLSEAVVRRADIRISFSNLTFPHQLMRVMLLSVLAEAICDR